MTKDVLLKLTELLKSLPDDKLESLGNAILMQLRANQGSFDEVDFIIRELVCNIYLSQEEFKSAGEMLGGINFDSNTNPFTDQKKANLLLKCAGMS